MLWIGMVTALLAPAQGSSGLQVSLASESQDGPSTVTVLLERRAIASRSFEFHVTSAAVANSGRVALVGHSTSPRGQEGVFAVWRLGERELSEYRWHITAESEHDPAAPLPTGLFVNDASGYAYVRANAQTPMDWAPNGIENWWILSLETGSFVRHAAPVTRWMEPGQLPQFGSLVSCVPVTSTPLLAAKWACRRGSPVRGRQVEVRERIQILDAAGALLFEVPSTSHRKTLIVTDESGLFDEILRISTDLGAHPVSPAPYRVDLIRKDEPATAVWCRPKDRAGDAAWEFVLADR